MDITGHGASPQAALALFFALVNLVVHMPFTDLPVLKDYDLGNLQQEYDYVIVGGGSAGCVIANRLSANPNVSVLLLEAGGLEEASRQIPIAAPYNLGGHDDWAYESVPQENACLSFQEQLWIFRQYSPIVWSVQLNGYGVSCVSPQMWWFLFVERELPVDIIDQLDLASQDKHLFDSLNSTDTSGPSVARLHLLLGASHILARCSEPRGKVLGGSSVLNFMVYTRGNKADYDRWAREYGATGWAYDDVLPYFKDIEDYRAGEPDDYHGVRGEVPVDHANGSTPLGEIFLNACKESGYPLVDYNGESQSGCSRVQTNLRNGERVSASKAFIQPILPTRKNLYVALFSHVTKVNFKERHAVGVTVTMYGKTHNVFARHEVILSAGTVESAKILMLSGVGPREDLERLQIPVVVDLPVGRNLQEHALLRTAVPVSTAEYLGIPPFTLEDIAQYANNRTGSIAIPAGVEALQFVSSDYAPLPGIPDIELILLPSAPASEMARAELSGSKFLPEVYNKYFGPDTDQPGFRVGAVNNRPKSRGTVRLRTANTNDYPIIDPRLLEHPHDVKALAQGIKTFIDRMLDTEAMKSIGAKPWNVTFHRCAKAGPLWSLKYVECLIRHLSEPCYHLCCTAPMGSHAGSVVDERLRVRGNVTGLRVADSSVMPDIISGHTNAPAMMIGSKAAAMIREDNGH